MSPTRREARAPRAGRCKRPCFVLAAVPWILEHPTEVLSVKPSVSVHDRPHDALCGAHFAPLPSQRTMFSVPEWFVQNT